MSSGAQRQRFFFFIWGLVLFFAVFLGISLGVVCGLSDMGKSIIASGVSVQGIDVGGQTTEQALATLESQLNFNQLEEDLLLRWQDKEWKLSPKDIQARLDLATGINQAMRVGRGQGFFADLYQRYIAKTEGKDIPLHLLINDKKLSSYLEDLAREINREPVNAQLLTNPDDTIQVVGEQPGEKLNLAKAKSKIKEQLLKTDKEILLPVELWQAEVTAGIIHSRGIKRLLSSFATNFSTAKENRAYNIYVAAKAIDGVMLKPGEVFSFNKIVGPRSQEAGYKTAGVIVNNELVEGIGGGVCQVSSTLYNAVLLADLQIVERSNHSRPVAYLPLGRDATVAYDYLDFKFKNSTGSYVLIRAEVDGGRLLIRLFGNQPPGERVSIVTETDAVLPSPVKVTPDKSLPTGGMVVEKEGDSGCRVNTWRTVEINGKEVRRELVGHSTYNPVARIIRKGI